MRAHAVPAPRRAWQLLVMEARLLHPGVWAASFLVMAVCAGFAAMRVVVPEVVLGLSVPLVAGTGVAGLYGPERDRAFEVVAVTPTSPRVVLLARVTLVFGYDLVLALLVSGVLAVAGGSPGGVAGLVTAWLGPMALLAAVALLLSVCWRPGGAIGVALAAWCVPALAEVTDAPVPDGYRVLWQSGPWTIALAVALAGTAVALAGRVELLRRAGATH
ncbi:hypothetical protein [Nonomuraea cavernae]|uniref:Uncharacterized protein n=1 Tax=Nonomuraea cavernae TaxID=2045107 RepID=A0A917Z200_9ACTN|nr:hypothetical protein [Nonomuraea cavernae]MCA2187766.1 hypothetical protein [Nonomuraea cavernae]GGO71789.1 hypothetical protein GCM10012289_38290 [Nonomuraea cavernae]